MLNPWAPEFTPGQALRGRAGVEAKAADNEWIEDTFDLADLPSEVITSMFSYITDPRDLGSCICACKLLKETVQNAELVLDIRSWRSASVSGNINSIEGFLGNSPKALMALSKYMPGTVALLLPNLPHDDSDLASLLEKLPRLQMLDVSGARKITHTGVTTLTARASPASSPATTTAQRSSPRFPPECALPVASASEPGPQGHAHGCTVVPLAAPASAPAPPVSAPLLRFLNLQRCFQLHCGSLDAALLAPGLSCLALSHLDLGRWPPPAPAPPPLPPSSSQSVPLHLGSVLPAIAPERPSRAASAGVLQVLALNNCLRLHGAAIDALAAACRGGDRASASAACGGGGIRFLLLGGSTLALSSFLSAACTPPDLPPRLESALAAAYRPASTYTAATVQAHLAAARHLAVAALSLPALVALELTFFPPPLVQCLRSVLSDADMLCCIGRATSVEVWDFASEAADVEAARWTLRRALRAAPAAMVAASAAAAVMDDLSVMTVLRCAVNCSSVTRSTPLHVSAERGAAVTVAALLAAGAIVNARDTAGSTPLFLACEAGHTAVVERLLSAGADPGQGNSAGETPLYIAALRGHLGCVKALLRCCTARGIAWQDPDLYGDAWTPLHAAAVANRADVAAYLLQAAGAAGAGELVLAPNKYGQSVLHVAARKGSAQLLRLLLSAGGVEVVGSRDGSGDTPVDVAKKNRHVAALAEFRAAVHGTARAAQATATAMA